MRKKKLPVIAILCPVGPGEDPSAMMAPWVGLGDVADIAWVWGFERAGRPFMDRRGHVEIAPSFPAAWTTDSVIYDLRDCPSDDPMRRETWARNRLYSRARDIGADRVISIDADEACINPREVIADLALTGGIPTFARWRTIVAETSGPDAIAVGPWGDLTPLGMVHGNPPWEPYSGFLLGGPADLGAGPFLRGRAVENGKRHLGPGIFVHRAWANTKEKIASWSHARDGRELLHFETRVLMLQAAARGGGSALMRVAKMVGEAENWSPYPNARWPRVCMWRVADLDKMDAVPVWISEAKGANGERK